MKAQNKIYPEISLKDLFVHDKEERYKTLIKENERQNIKNINGENSEIIPLNNQKSNIRINEIKNKENYNNFTKDMINKISKNSKNIINFTKARSAFFINCLFIFILIYQICNIHSYLIKNNINKSIIFFSYEITLKVIGTGIKKILSESYPFPSNIYLDDELYENIIDFYYVNLTEPNSEIKMEWNNTIINSTKSMFYNCTEIVEIDMTKFDTSSVTDMSEMFLLCSSLNF